MSVFDNLLIGQSPAFLAVQRAAQIVAGTDVTVLITGETGTGKELLASAIHQHSKRREAPFITINCAALPENLIESELFGYRKGAFTGADHDHAGWVRSAAGGTLFLDEIGEIPLAIQAKLLRFLESGEYQPVGQAKTEKVDVRICTATNQDLATLVEKGQFRADLYYRLNVVPLQLPPLRERKEDIIPLIKQISARLAKEHKLKTPQYSSSAVKLLSKYHWPGNVRELRNVCERLLVLLNGQQVSEHNLPIEIRQGQRKTSNEPFTLPDNGLRLEELEMSMINQALDKSHGNQSKAARLLGLTRSTLIYRMKKFAIN